MVSAIWLHGSILHYTFSLPASEPNYPLSCMGEHDLIRVLMPGTSGLMARLRKIILGARGQSLDGWGSTSPDHFQSFQSLRSILKRAMWVISAGSFQCCSPVGISFGYIAQKTQEKNGLKPEFPTLDSFGSWQYDRGKSVLQTHNLRETVLSVLQTHTTYPSFRETFLGALHASAHVLLVACSPHVARQLRNRLLPGQTQDQLTKNHRYFCRELANSHRPI